MFDERSSEILKGKSAMGCNVGKNANAGKNVEQFLLKSKKNDVSIRHIFNLNKH